MHQILGRDFLEGLYPVDVYVLIEKDVKLDSMTLLNQMVRFHKKLNVAPEIRAQKVELLVNAMRAIYPYEQPDENLLKEMAVKHENIVHEDSINKLEYDREILRKLLTLHLEIKKNLKH